MRIVALSLLLCVSAFDACAHRHGVVTEVDDGTADEVPPSVRDEAPLPPAELALELLGPYPTLSAICEQLEIRARSNFGDMDRGDVGFECRTDVAVVDRDPPGLTEEELGGGWLNARFLLVGTSVEGYWGELRLVLETKAGWFYSAKLLHIAQGNLPHAFVRLDLQALPLAPGEGKEVFAVAGHEWGFERREENDHRGVHYGEEKTAVCTLVDGAPRCLAAATSWFETEFSWDGYGSRRKETVLTSEEGHGTVSFPENGVLELAYPGTDEAEKRNLAGVYRW